MSIEKVIEELKEQYSDHESFEEMINDLGESNCVDYWAEKLCSEEFGKNLDLSKKLYSISLETAEDSSDFRGLADALCEQLNDKEWARAVYAKAEEKAEGSFDFSRLAESIYEKLGDKEWTKKVYEKVEGKAEDSSDFCNLAESIHEKLGDKEWVKKMYMRAEEKAEDSSDFKYLADALCEQLNDKEWAGTVYAKVEDKIRYISEFSDLADALCKQLNDKEWARTVYAKAEEKAADSSDFKDLADGLCEQLNDKEWARTVYAKAEEKAEDSSDFKDLAESLYEKLGDKEWGKNIFKKAEDEAIWDHDYIYLGQSVIKMLEDKEWGKQLFKMAEEKISGFSPCIQLAEEAVIPYFNDKEWVRGIFETAEAHANDGEDLYALSTWVLDYLEDKPWANHLKQDAIGQGYEEEIESDDDGLESIELGEYENTRLVVRFTLDYIMSREEDAEIEKFDDTYSEESRLLIGGWIYKFISDIKEKLSGYVEDRILIGGDMGYREGHIYELHDGISKIDDFDCVPVYMVLTKNIPIDLLDSILLGIDQYGFYAFYPNDKGQVITQGYDYGEYNTGYFSPSAVTPDKEHYIDQNIESYKRVKDILINNSIAHEKQASKETNLEIIPVGVGFNRVYLYIIVIIILALVATI